MTNRHLVIYDGVCIFCNGAVKFIIKRDAQARFAFTPMQTGFAQDLMRKYGIDNRVDTFALIKNDRVFLWSSAALEISKDLSGGWYLFNILRIIPAPVRDFIYRLFAKNRYKLFGRQSQCELPDQRLADRFLGLD